MTLNASFNHTHSKSMKSKTAILSAIWLLSLASAYIVGAKITSGSQKTDTANDSNKSSRPSYRDKISSSSANSDSNKDSSLSSSTGNRSSQKNIVSIMRQSNPIERVNSLLAIIQGLDPNDFAQLTTDFRTAGFTRTRANEYNILLHAWAKADPLAALAYTEENNSSNASRQTILASWAADSPDAALHWAETNHDGDGENPWLVGVVEGLVGSDLQKASEIISSMAYSRERGDALNAITPYITRQGLEKSIEWLDSIEDERLRNGSTRRVAEQLARQDPEATAAWVATLEEEESRINAIGEVADTWSQQDLASALAWSNSLSGAEKARAAQELIGRYAREDLEEASQWLDSFSGSEGYDGIATSFIRNSVASDPALALAKTSTLQNNQSQNRYNEVILSNWHRRDAEAAAAWMQANNVSDELRQRATRTRNNGNRGRGRR